eukprot:TRINITY_DN3232_c0_g1_i2.p1 TRINITY_DN3232_c0_g1~~TRINITY_DN3232_c0_g1_i2.p1  ORF type:complete len:1197 (+),score=321.12 TRINITY_DN3232_c0_g1_i2:284-3592(+)
MEYCDGGDLSKIIKGCQMKKTFLEENVIWNIFSQLVLALNVCHSSPSGAVLHRDIKPGNIFLTTTNLTKLGDFGVSRTLNDRSVARTMVGTPIYMSPEQMNGAPYDTKSDIWALGCVLYEMCTLKPPFMANNQVALALKIQSGKYAPIAPNQGYSVDLINLVEMMLSFSAKDRPDIKFLMDYPPISAIIHTKANQGSTNPNTTQAISSSDVFDAAALGDVEVLKRVIVWCDQDINVHDAQGNTALHICALLGHKDAVEFLLSCDASFEIKNAFGKTPFYVSMEENHLEIAAILSNIGADVNTCSLVGSTCLGDAVSKGNLEHVKFLYEHGADLNLRHIDGRTPLYSAVRERHFPITTFLIEKGVNIDIENEDGQTALFAAVINDDLETLRFLIGRGSKTTHKDKNENTILFLPDISPQILRFVLLQGAKLDVVNRYGMTPFTFALRNCNLETACVLADFGAQVTSAVLCSLALDICSDVAFLENELCQCLEYMHGLGFDVNIVDTNGVSLFEHSILAWHPNAVRLLLEKGLDISVEKIDNVLIRVCLSDVNVDDDISRRKRETASFLLNELGANSNILFDGFSSLFHSIRTGNLSVAEVLLDNGMSLNDEAANLLLFDLVTRDNVDVKNRQRLCDTIEFLTLLVGVNLETRDNLGLSPFDCAILAHNIDIAQILLQAGAQLPMGQADWLAVNVVGQDWVDQKAGVDTLRFLITKCGASPDAMNEESMSLLEMCVFRDKIDAIICLLEQNTTIDIDAIYILIYGLLTDSNPDKHCEMIRWLLVELEIDVAYQIDGQYWFDIAANAGALEVCLMLEQLNAPQASASVLLLLHSLANKDLLANQIPLINSILEKVDATQPLPNETEPLLEKAIRHGNLALCGCLSTVDIIPHDKKEATRLLHLAISSEEENLGVLRVINWLVKEFNASVDETIVDDQTGLHIAVSTSLTKMRWLIEELGASPNCVDPLGNTPLHLAVVQAKEDAAIFLVEHGADINQTNNYDMSAYSVSSSSLKGKLTVAAEKYFQEQKSKKRLTENTTPVEINPHLLAYQTKLKDFTKNGRISVQNKRELRKLLKELDLSRDDHLNSLAAIGWTQEDYEDGERL